MSALTGKMTVTAVLSTIIGDVVKMVSVPPGAVVPPPEGPGGPGGGTEPPIATHPIAPGGPEPTFPINLPPGSRPPPGYKPPPTAGQPLPPTGGGGTPPNPDDIPHPEHPIYYPPGTRPEAGQDLPGYQPPAGWPEGCPYPTPYGLDRAMTRGLEGSAVVGELTIITTQGSTRPGQVYDVEFTLAPGETVEPGARGGKGGQGQGGQGQSQSGPSSKAKPKSSFP